MVAPRGSLITISGSGGPYQLYVNTAESEYIIEPFDRPEFSNAKLREAPTANGAKPLIVTSFGGKPIQLASTCTGDSPRPLNPDDDNINSIKQQFKIDRYTLTGVESLNSDVNGVNTIYKEHAGRINRFNFHQEKVGMELSYPALINLQSQSFWWLTNTGVIISGTCLGGSLTNCLIISFNPEVAYIYTSSGGLLKTWQLVFDQRTITDRTG